MSPRELHLSTRRHRNEPSAESSMGCVGCSPIDCVHLLLVLLDGNIDEESRAGEACTAPDNIRRSVKVPSCDFSDHSLTLNGICEICTDIEEPLFVGVSGMDLSHISAIGSLEENELSHLHFIYCSFEF